jgi:hypothetical protein
LNSRLLTGAKHIVYEVLCKITPGQVSVKQILQKTGYKDRRTVMRAVTWLVLNNYVDRSGSGSGTPYAYKVRDNVLDT